jgi:peptide deformylase
MNLFNMVVNYMILKVLTEKNKKLAKVCAEVKCFDNKLHKLLDNMKETMYKNKGIGLAAPQVGILLRVVVIDIGKDYFELINPKIIESSGEQQNTEGCLSCPGVFGITIRPKFVRAVGYNRNNELFEVFGENLKSCAICHELDHLEGILFKSRLAKFKDPAPNKLFWKK